MLIKGGSDTDVNGDGVPAAPVSYGLYLDTVILICKGGREILVRQIL